MKRILSALILVLVFGTAYGQLNNRVGRTPAITNDWRPSFVNITEFQSGMGLANISVPYSKNYMGVTTVNGYQFSRNIKAGIGLGMLVHNGGTLFPVFVDGRFNLNAQVVVPFFDLSGGAMLSADNFDAESRVFFSPMVGVKYIVRSRKAIAASIGLMTEAGGAERRSSFICFRIGIEFKGKEWKF